MRAFPVQLPSDVRYWTVVDDDLAVVPEADAFLRHVRFGKDQAELTTRTYAGHIALYLRWCIRTGRDWRVAAEELGLFIVWLKFGSKPVTGIERPVGNGLVYPGPGAEAVREPARIRNVLTGVRQFLLHGITTKTVPSPVMAQLYEVAESWDLPEQARGEELTGYRMRPRHRVQVPRKKGERATDREIVELFLACRTGRTGPAEQTYGRRPVCRTPGCGQPHRARSYCVNCHDRAICCARRRPGGTPEPRSR